MKIVSELKELENKKFNTEEECKKAEKEILAKRHEKEKASLTRKEDAELVTNAVKAVNAAKKEHNKSLKEINDEYSKKFGDLKKAYINALDNADNKLETAEKDYEKALNEFLEKHPEGYHATIKDGDETFDVNISGKTSNIAEDIFDLMTVSFIDFPFGFFR